MAKNAVASGSGSTKQENKSVVGSNKASASPSNSSAHDTRQLLSKKAAPVGSGSTKQGVAPKGTVGENKSVIGSSKAPSATSKPESQIRCKICLLTLKWFSFGVVAAALVIAIFIGLYLLIEGSGTTKMPTNSTTSKHGSSTATSTLRVTTTPIVIQPAVCQDGQGGGVKNECMIIPTSCNRQCEYYKYEWPLKNDSIKNGSFNGASHVCQEGNVMGWCNTEGRCVTNDDTNTNVQVSQSKGANWIDICKPNPCWDKTSEDTINTWTGKGVVNLTECKVLAQTWNVGMMNQYCRPNASAVLSVQHRRCNSGKRCDQRPFRVWVCANCPGPLQPFTSCQDQSNGAMCTDGYCLGDVCVRVDDRINPNQPSEC